MTKQKPNSKFLGIFGTRLWIYNRTNSKDSLKKFNSWLNRKVAEKPTIYSPKTAEKTAESMQFYLNNKGFFDAKVGYKADTKKQKTVVTYTVKPNRSLLIDSVNFDVDYPDLLTILNKNNSETLLKPGDPVDNTLFDQEKSRISKLFRNKGYAYFYPNYVKFLSYDSTAYKADVTTSILPSEDGGDHEIYQVGDVYIYPGFLPTADDANLDTLDMGGGYFFISKGGKLGIKTKPILNAIFLEKGTTYSQDAYDATNMKLGNLGIYKFVSIRYNKNRLKKNELTFHIFLTPIKKQELGYSFEVYTDNINALGTGVNLNYRNRNFFKGAEVFLISVENGLEFALTREEDDTGVDRIFNSIDLSGRADIYFPKFIVPFKLSRNMRNNSPKTRLSLNVDYTKRRNYYTNTLFSASYGYDWQVGKHVRHVLNPASINFLVINEIEQNFQNILDSNIYLANGFVDQFFLGGNYTFVYTGPTFRNGNSWFFKGNVDVAGNTTYLFDQIIRPNVNFEAFGNKVDYSQYARFDADLRYYNNLGRRSTFASRVTASTGFAFGNSKELGTIPYVKQYSVGGTSSVRAWKLRELGPGSYYQNQDTVRQAYQAGDFRLEGSIEYRFDIFSALEGALFIDAGNVWTLREDEDRPGSKLSKDFLKQIAVGFGYGLRFDFSYFVIRLDLAYKLRSPYIDPESGFDRKAFESLRFRDATFNLAVGYPF